MSKKNSGGIKISFIGLLQTLFIGLKLGKVISWSWFWVLSPMIFLTLLVLFIFIIIGIVVAIKDEL